MKEQETFNEVMLRYRGLLFSVCRRYSSDGLEVDDLLQETVLTLWKQRERLFDITVAPKQAAWIWRVARSTCIDLQRTNRPTELLPEGYDPPEEDRSLHIALHELIDQLPEPDHTIVTMHLEGYDYKEIGNYTGLSKNNVGVRLMRIKDRLRKEMIIEN
ncbi:MAG: sigma-70 family RNA polymerase sigma factor [Bacteroidales bacterium]|nr:sigma-70 family RNA polymerase sigma factor [Bacteroidales bacterium]